MTKTMSTATPGELTRKDRCGPLARQELPLATSCAHCGASVMTLQITGLGYIHSRQVVLDNELLCYKIGADGWSAECVADCRAIHRCRGRTP